MIPVLIFSVAVLALPAAPPVPVLMTVPVEGSLTRRIVRLWIVAATLFMVMTRGRLMTFALPSSSRAVKRVESDCEPSIEPSARSSAEPVPAPNPDPKPRLLEDYELGLHVLLAGYRNRYLHDAHVAQEALPGARRLLTQRTRWVQGNLQCLRYLPAILRRRYGSGKARASTRGKRYSRLR